MAPILAGCLGLNFNNDIQIPHRFPIVEEVHDGSVCTEKCWQEGEEVHSHILSFVAEQYQKTPHQVRIGSEGIPTESYKEVQGFGCFQNFCKDS